MSDTPTVKVAPTFKKGETVILKDTGKETKITAINANGALRLEGYANLVSSSSVEKKI